MMLMFLPAGACVRRVVSDCEVVRAQGTLPCAGSAEKLEDGIRLAYSTVLDVKSSKEAQGLLAKIFTIALTRNPPKPRC